VIFIEIFVAALSAWALTEVIRHGSIFERQRAWLEARGGPIAEWIGCAFCFSHWAALLTSAGTLFVWEDVLWEWTTLVKLLLVWLCAVRLANLGNDLTHKWCRTPREEEIEFDLADKTPIETTISGTNKTKI